MKRKSFFVIFVMSLVVLSPHISAVYYQSAQHTIESEINNYEKLIAKKPGVVAGFLVFMITFLSLILTIILQCVFFTGFQILVTMLYEILLETGLLYYDWLFLFILLILTPLLIPFFAMLLIPTNISIFLFRKIVGEEQEKLIELYTLFQHVSFLLIEIIILKSIKFQGDSHI